MFGPYLFFSIWSSFSFYVQLIFINFGQFDLFGQLYLNT